MWLECSFISAKLFLPLEKHPGGKERTRHPGGEQPKLSATSWSQNIASELRVLHHTAVHAMMPSNYI